MPDTKFHDEECCESSDSQALLHDVPLGEEKRELQKPQKMFSCYLVILMLSAHALGWMLAYLVLSSPDCNALSGGDDVNGIVPRIRTKLVKFDFKTDDWVPGPNDPNVTDTIFDNWSSLLPNGNGMVKVPDWHDYTYLTQPTELVHNETAYNTAWVHQLHCVYWVMREYHRVLHHGPDGTEYFIDPTHNSYHTSHCFNYIRQAILCGLDTTLEGSGEGVGVADGSGQMHVCRDNGQSIHWLEENRYVDFRAIA